MPRKPLRETEVFWGREEVGISLPAACWLSCKHLHICSRLALEPSPGELWGSLTRVPGVEGTWKLDLTLAQGVWRQEADGGCLSSGVRREGQWGRGGPTTVWRNADLSVLAMGTKWATRNGHSYSQEVCMPGRGDPAVGADVGGREKWPREGNHERCHEHHERNHENITYTRNGEVRAKKGRIEAGTNVPGRTASLTRSIPM